MTGARAAAIRNLQDGRLDVLIAGGGVNGAGVLRDLALRGNLRAGLVDKHHFGSGTSGKNSHLIHGGLRYLKYLDVALVREALRERSILLRTAPDYVKPLEFLLPFRSRFEQWFYRAGLVVYDALAGNSSLPGHGALSAQELYTREPGLAPGFQAAASYYDCSVASAKLVLANIVDAMRHGATAANYIELRSAARDGSGWRAVCADRITGAEFEVRARKLVDATGAWTQETGVRLVRGSHLVIPRVNSSDAAVAYFEGSGRIVFLIPWGSERQCTLVGTTEADHDAGPDEIRISPEETAYLRSKVKEVFGVDPEPISTFSSLRPLVLEPGREATSTSREHRIWNDNQGMLHITGGKYTTYRLMSEEAADLVCQEIAPDHAGKRPTESAQFPARATDLNGIVAEAAQREMAQHLTDLLFGSTTWGYERRWSPDELHALAVRLGSHLGWTAERIREEAARAFA